MSVIIRGGASATISGSSSKGFPPGDVTSISSTVNNGRVLIKWSDPKDTVVDGTTISAWKGTLLIRNADRHPESIKDGDVVLDNTTRDKYKNTWYTDSGLTNNHKYYYRFFPYNTAKVYNDSSNLVFAAIPLSFAPTLKDNTWEQIKAASEGDAIPSTWKVGDEINITLSGTFNETVTLQIWDFKHFDKSDGSGKAGIVFGMKHLMKNYQQMNSSDTNSGGWNNTAMKKTVMANILKSMPSNLQSYIKEVNTYASMGGGSSSSNAGRPSKDKVFLPGDTEVYDRWFSQAVTESNQKKFPIFTDNNSRIKKMNNGSGDASMWWTRSPYYGNGADGFFAVNYNGGPTPDGSSTSNGVCFCFNI